MVEAKNETFNKPQIMMIETQIPLYLPSDYIRNVLGFIHNECNRYHSVCVSHFNPLTSTITLRGSISEINNGKMKIEKLIDDVFTGYLMTEFGNIGRWSDIE